jgi:predicted RNase H-like nuclease
VARHLDLDALAAGLDLDRIVTRVDLDAAARRLHLDELATRLDLDRVVARVDLDAIIARIDLEGLAREVIDAVDLPEIVRRSTGSLTSETVRSVRTEAMHADDAVTGLVDRLLRRSRVQAQAHSPAVP